MDKRLREIIDRLILQAPMTFVDRSIRRKILASAKPGEMIKALSDEERQILSNLKSEDLAKKLSYVEKCNLDCSIYNQDQVSYNNKLIFEEFDKKLKLEKFRKYASI